MTTKKGFATIGSVLKTFQSDKDKYISHEFQKYGYELARELGDLKRKSLYIKLAKETPRGLLESAKNFVKDAKDVRNRGALFIWKLTQLRKLKKQSAKLKNARPNRSSTPGNRLMAPVRPRLRANSRAGGQARRTGSALAGAVDQNSKP